MLIYAAVFNKVHKVHSANLDCVFQIWNPKNGQKPPEPKVQAHFQTDLHCKAAIYSSQTCVTNYVKGWGNSEPTSRVAGRNFNVNIYRKSLEEKSSWEGISRTLVEYLITNLQKALTVDSLHGYTLWCLHEGFALPSCCLRSTQHNATLISLA